MDNTTVTSQEQEQIPYRNNSHGITFTSHAIGEAVTILFNIDIAIIFTELNTIHKTIKRIRAEMVQLKAERNALAEQVSAQKARIAELEMEVDGARSL